MYTHTYTHTYSYIYIYIRIYIHTYIHTHTHTHRASASSTFATQRAAWRSSAICASSLPSCLRSRWTVLTSRLVGFRGGCLRSCFLATARKMPRSQASARLLKTRRKRSSAVKYACVWVCARLTRIPASLCEFFESPHSQAPTSGGGLGAF